MGAIIVTPDIAYGEEHDWDNHHLLNIGTDYEAEPPGDVEYPGNEINWRGHIDKLHSLGLVGEFTGHCDIPQLTDKGKATAPADIHTL